MKSNSEPGVKTCSIINRQHYNVFQGDCHKITVPEKTLKQGVRRMKSLSWRRRDMVA